MKADATVVRDPAVAVSPSFAPGAMLSAILLCAYGALGLFVDYPRAAGGIFSDVATYYMMGHSLAEDGDLTYRRDDLVRVWEEFPSGPSGLFLKRGEDVLDAGLMRRPPFVWTRTQPDPDATRLFFGKAYIYPLAASPFVWAFGTNGFLVLHAILLSLVAWCGYLFLHARMPARAAALLAGGFVMATVVPVYFVWITPELFNFSLAALAYFCWLYKEVAPPAHLTRWTRWLTRPSSDVLAAVLLGIAMFSKPNLLFLPLPLWFAWRRQWLRGALVSAIFVAVAAGLFAINVAISGDWNYQGGDRRTFLWEFPFQTPSSGFDVVQRRHGRDEALTDIIFARSVFWTNLVHNLKWFFVGRYAGLIPYFFPAVFALGAYLLTLRRRPAWQHFVVIGGVAQILLFIIATPYTWGGGGGSIGNRYFMGAYGVFLFLLPVVQRASVALVPWAVGLFFMAPLVLNPFQTSFRPGDAAKQGPLRLLPVELSMVLDWPINTEGPPQVRAWFGDNPGQGDPGFQIYFFDDNAYPPESDKSFWVKGEATAEYLIKTDRPMRRLTLNLTAGAVATRVVATLEGRSQDVALAAGGSQQITFALPKGFIYQGQWPVWVASVSSREGFVPLFYGHESDARYLGVRVKPVLVE